MEPFPPVAESKKWPPEKGWPLFFAWVAGGMVNAIGILVVNSIGIPSIWDLKTRLTLGAPALVSQLWQASLLFRGRPFRFAMWAGMPWVIAIVWTLDNANYLWMLSLFASAVLLIRVRQRVWIWFLIQIAFVVLFMFGGRLINLLGLQFKMLLDHAFGPLPASANRMLRIGFGMNGIGLLFEFIRALALARWMPPMIPRGAKAQPPTRGDSSR